MPPPKNLTSYFESLPSFIKEPDPSIYLGDNYVYVDFETTNLDKGSPYNKENKLVYAGWILGKDHPLYDPEREYTDRWGSEYELGDLVEACERAEYIVAHNVKFELGWLRRCGLDLYRVLSWCTQIGEYVIAGNRSFKLDLDSCLKRYGIPGKVGVVKILMEQGVCPSEIPAGWLEKYGRQDVERGHDLFLKQRQKIQELELLSTQYTRCIFTPVLESMERVGMHLDGDRVQAVAKKINNELYDCQKNMDELTGGINTLSPIQKAKFLYKDLGFPIPKDFRGNEVRGKPAKNPNTLSAQEFPDGVPTTDSKYTSQFKARNKRQQAFLDLLSQINKLKDAKSKAIDKFQACVEETDDHILTAAFNQTITGTHRLSSSGRNYKAQFQNFPNKFKPVFSPRYPDWLFGEVDEAQLEYRMAVFLGRDETGLHDILNKVDAHAFTASIIFKEEWEACGGDKSTSTGKEVRRLSKSHTFKPLYGGKSGTDREKEYYQAFQDKHVGITEAQQEWLKEVYTTRKLKTITGLKFYWLDAEPNRYGTLIRPDGRPVDQSVCNYPVQSFATAEVVPIAVTGMWHLMHTADMQSFLVSTIHDSALGEINPNERELFEEIGVYSMTGFVYYYLHKVYGINLDVPLEAEVSIGSHWSDNEDWKEEYLRGFSRKY